METISITGLQQLCGFHSLQCMSKGLPFCRGGSGSLGFQMGAQFLPRNQWDSRKSGIVFNSFLDSTTLLKKSIKPSSWRVRAGFIRSRCFPSMQGGFVDVKGWTSIGTGSLQIDSSGKNRSPVHSGDGSTANASDSILDGEETAQDASTSSSSSSLRPPWNFKLKKVDWNNLIFNWSKDEPLWTVPWTGQTIFQVMVLWFAAFWVMGSWILPIAAQIAGFSRHSLTFRGQALYSLVTDIAEGTVGIWILKRCLTQFFPLPDGWFPVKWQGKWFVEVFWSCLLFPFVNKLSQLNLHLVPLPTLNTTYVEQSMMSSDPVATLLYAIVISVCAPVWEEVIFRGFLLPSMTRYMPLWGAILVSALAFALAHFSLQRILPLTFLGLVMGFVFVRSKNLLASIVLHSLWNGFAFLELL